jgi:hypothetical protein
MFWIAKSTNPLAERMNWAMSPTPSLMFDAVETFASPSSTSFFIYICRLAGSFSSVETSLASEAEVSGALPALRTIVRVFT